MSSSEDKTNINGESGEGLSFAERLGAEPRETAAALRAGEDVDPALLNAADEAEALEDRIEATLRAPNVPAGLVDELLTTPKRAKTRRGPPSWLAIAASVVLLVGISGVVWLGEGPGEKTVADYVEAHYHNSTEAMLAMTGEHADPAQVAAVLTRLGATASPELAGRIQFIKICPTRGSTGAQMVVSTDDGRAAVIFMPEVDVDEPLVLSIDGVEANVISLESGSAAIIGAGDEATRELRASLETGIHPMYTDT